jgi:hypothetical protein
MIGVRLTLGYRREKKRLVEEPAIANKMERIHIRGVSMDRVRLSVAATEALTCAYGELSTGFTLKSCKSPSSDASSSSRLVRLDDVRWSAKSAAPSADGSSPLALKRASNRDSCPSSSSLGDALRRLRRDADAPVEIGALRALRTESLWLRFNDASDRALESLLLVFFFFPRCETLVT